MNKTIKYNYVYKMVKPGSYDQIIYQIFGSCQTPNILEFIIKYLMDSLNKMIRTI